MKCFILVQGGTSVLTWCPVGYLKETEAGWEGKLGKDDLEEIVFEEGSTLTFIIKGAGKTLRHELTADGVLGETEMVYHQSQYTAKADGTGSERKLGWSPNPTNLVLLMVPVSFEFAHKFFNDAPVPETEPQMEGQKIYLGW